MKYGETMNFSLDKQMERVIEVLALSALLQATPKQKIGNSKEVRRLRQFAYPHEIQYKQYNHHFQETVYCCGDDDCEGCEE